MERLKGLHALIVDDNATNRRILEETLTLWEMHPISVESGSAALDALDRIRVPFQLILLDAHMPEMDGFTLARRMRGRPDVQAAKLVMLTSGGQPGDAAQCKELGFAAYLTKPVKQNELSRTLLRVLDSENAVAESISQPTSTPTPPVRSLRILLAEDNPMNQKLAVRLLEKQGHRVAIANNGREALAALASSAEHYDIVLMDVQMPEMDGLETASAIRAREKAVGGHMPIIAMTAYAMSGDREKCLAAGMDAYLSKPIRPNELFKLIAELVPAVTSEQPAPEKPTSHVANDLIDWKRALEHMRGDSELLRELIGIFLAELPKWLGELREAIAKGDFEQVRRTAHTLKGSVATFAADKVHAATLFLETMAREGRLDDGAKTLADIETELELLHPLLKAFADGDKSQR